MESNTPNISSIISFFNGNSDIVISKLEKKMYDSSAKLQFEKAIEYKEILDYIIQITKNFNFFIEEVI